MTPTSAVTVEVEKAPDALTAAVKAAVAEAVADLKAEVSRGARTAAHA